MIRVPDKLDEIIQANKTGQLWSMSAKELLLVCTQLKARSALEIQAAVRGQFQVALMLRRRRFIDDLRALGREVFPREFVIRGLGGMVRSPKPAPRGTQGVTVGDYSFGGLDFRYKSAQGGPTDEQAEQSVAPETGKKEALEVHSSVQFPSPPAGPADQPNDGGFSNNVVEQVEPLSSSPLSEGDVVECMETDEENPGALESPGVKLDVSTEGGGTRGGSYSGRNVGCTDSDGGADSTGSDGGSIYGGVEETGSGGAKVNGYSVTGVGGGTKQGPDSTAQI